MLPAQLRAQEVSGGQGAWRACGRVFHHLKLNRFPWEKAGVKAAVCGSHPHRD